MIVVSLPIKGASRFFDVSSSLGHAARIARRLDRIITKYSCAFKLLDVPSKDSLNSFHMPAPHSRGKLAFLPNSPAPSNDLVVVVFTFGICHGESLMTKLPLWSAK